MEHQISESDWKRLRRLKPIALERFCQRVLTEVVQRASDSATGSHARFLDVFKLIHARNDELAAAFDDLRRSMAELHLARIRLLQLVTDEEFATFSPKLRDDVTRLLSVMDARRPSRRP